MDKLSLLCLGELEDKIRENIKYQERKTGIKINVLEVTGTELYISTTIGKFKGINCKDEALAAAQLPFKALEGKYKITIVYQL